MGEALEIAKVMVDPIKKLIEALQSAIGKVYEPRHIRNMADAKAYEISTVGQAMREFCDIPATYHDGQIQLDTTDSESLVERTKSRLAFQELTKQNNIESVVDQSYQMLEGEPMVSNEPVDQGWMLRFMDSVGDISDSDLQRLWAKILSGEIKQPKSYSLKELRQGFFTVRGGHRIGVAGRVILKDRQITGLKAASFLNVRVAHEIKGCADQVLPFLYVNGKFVSTLIVSPPGCGKTTLLRDLICQVSDGSSQKAGKCSFAGVNVGVADERSELGACYQGVPQNDLGMRTDVLDGCPKSEGMLMLSEQYVTERST